jgi:hypothetical protein
MMRVIARLWGYATALLLAGTAALAAPAAAQAAASPPGPSLVPCSSSALVTAIRNASKAGSATLVLSPRCNYVLTTSTGPFGDDGLPPVTRDLTILGSQGTTISAAGHFRIFEVAGTGKLTLVGVTVANGAAFTGGGISDDGTLVLRSVRLTGNTGTVGGGLFIGSRANATVGDSELEGNKVSGGGGAIFNQGTLVMDRSTLARNSADQGGAVYTDLFATSRIGSTVVSRNSSVQQGGGFVNAGTTELTGDQVTFNSAEKGGGIFSFRGTVNLLHSVVALNSPDNCNPQGTIPGCRN